MSELSDERMAPGGAFVSRAEFVAETGHVDRMLSQLAETSLVTTDTIRLLRRRVEVLCLWLYVLSGLTGALLISGLVMR